MTWRWNLCKLSSFYPSLSPSLRPSFLPSLPSELKGMLSGKPPALSILQLGGGASIFSRIECWSPWRA